MYDAIVLAGGKSKGAGIGNGEYEALLNIGGRPMLYFVVDALKKSEKLTRFLLLGQLRSCQKRNCLVKLILFRMVARLWRVYEMAWHH